MVSENVTEVIKEVFPNLEIIDYDENEACVLLEQITMNEVQKLADLTKNWSGCEFIIENSSEQIQIIFRHTAFC